VNEARLPRDIVVIGGSAGSLAVIFTILQALPRDLEALVAIVMHRSPTYNGQLLQLLARRSNLPVYEPNTGDRLTLGRVYVAPPDRHLRVERARWSVARGARVHWARPAIDPLFLSAASTFGPRVVGVQLSGGGSDGVSGLIAIHAHGGLTVAQRPDEAQAPSMPSTAIMKDHIDAVLTADEIAAAIPGLVVGA
jgi:two-component system chemotaxis response regulator CheB